MASTGNSGGTDSGKIVHDTDRSSSVPPGWEALRCPATCRTLHCGTTLSNGLKVIVVHDPETQMSAAAMSIAAGSLQDPPELPGLAHLCEHMLFLGTEKYPEEGGYDRFITTHGGHDNAWTEDMTTNYYFTVSSAAFTEALDRFIHFFVTPLFTATSLEREVQAVHSEDEKNHNVDYWQYDEIWKSMLSAKHPASRYGNGNERTLWTTPRASGIDVRDALLRFYRQYYLANGATLCVHSNLPPEVVLRAVAPVLERMPSGVLPSQRFEMLDPLDQCTRGKWYNIRSVKSMHRLRAQFTVPYSVRLHETAPASYASHIVGHECEGSILAALKAEGLADALTAGSSGRGIDQDHDTFYVEVSLTEEGCRQLETVLVRVFEGIEVIRRSGYEAGLVEEDDEARELSFHLTPMGKPHNHAGSLARGSTVYGMKRAWTANHLRYGHDPEESMRALQFLLPDRAVFIYRSHLVGDVDALVKIGLPEVCRTPSSALSLTEHHHAKYHATAVPPSWLQRLTDITEKRSPLSPLLRLPSKNPYIAKELTVFPPDSQREPNVVPARFGRVLWRRDIGHHRMPLAFVAVEFQSPSAYRTTLNRFFTRVFVALLSDALTELSYFAELGHIHTTITATARGIEFRGGGPNEKLLAVFEKMVEEFFTYALTEPKYRVYAEKVSRDLQSAMMEQPYTLGLEAEQCWTHRVRWFVPEVVEATKSGDANYQNFEEFVGRARRLLLVDAFVYGNLSRETASEPTDAPPEVKQLTQTIDRLFTSHNVEKANASDLPDVRTVLQLPSPGTVHPSAGSYGASVPDQLAESWLLAMHNLNPADPNCSVAISCPVGPRDGRNAALTDATAAALKSLFFGALRTSETLGYVVICASAAVDDNCSLTFIVQSAAFDAVYVFSRIHAFMTAASTYLRHVMSESSLEDIVRSHIQALRDTPKTLEEEGLRLWSRRHSRFGYFQEDEQITALQQLSREQVADFFDKRVLAATKLIVAMFPHHAGGVPVQLPAGLERDEAYQAHLDQLGESGVIQRCETAKWTLPARRTALTGKEEITLPSYESDDNNVATSIHLRLLPNATLRDAFRSQLVPYNNSAL